MGKFARIIELPNDEQVVLIKTWNEEDGFTFDLHTEVDGMGVKVTSTYKTEEKRDTVFDAYSEENALVFYKEMRELLIEE